MFGFGRRPGAKAISARGEIAHVDHGLPGAGSPDSTTAARFTVRVRVFPDDRPSFEAEVKVELRGTAAPMVGEETWVRFDPRTPDRLHFDRDRIKVRSYERVEANPGLRGVVDTVYAHGDAPITVFASAR